MPKPSSYAIETATVILAKITAYDPHYAKPSEATILMWAEHLMIANVDQEDLLAAVTQFYFGNVDNIKPLPANITSTAKTIRQDRALRSDYQPPPSKAAADDTAEILGGFVAGPVKHKTARLLNAQERLQACEGREESKAAIREFFAAKKQAQLDAHTRAHPARVEAAEKARANA